MVSTLPTLAPTAAKILVHVAKSAPVPTKSTAPKFDRAAQVHETAKQMRTHILGIVLDNLWYERGKLFEELDRFENLATTNSIVAENGLWEVIWLRAAILDRYQATYRANQARQLTTTSSQTSTLTTEAEPEED